MSAARGATAVSSTHASASWQRRVLAAAVACVTLACGGGDPAPAAPAGRPRGVTSEAPAPEQQPAAQPSIPAYGDTVLAPSQPTAAAADKPEEKPEEKKRDFGEELRQMMSGAASCLKPREAAAAFTHVDIALSAVVTPSGAVSRGEASSGLLGADELACLRGQVEALHFADPIENAPFTVSATLGINQAPPPAAAAPTPAPDAPNAAEPAAPAPEAAPSAP